MSTWSNARSTLGQGTPQDGAPFDNSTQLRQMQSNVQSAAPGGRWTGSASDAYAEANSTQGRVLGQMAGLDQRLGVEVDRSAAVVAAGRQNLDGVKQWVLNAAASVPQSDDREQQLLPIARKGIGDVADVVKQTNNDLNAIGARIRTIGNEYQALGDDEDHKDPNDPLNKVVGDDDKSKQQAQQDVEAALGGNKDAAGRVATVLNSITPDQLAGKKPLTPEQASYLSQMQAQQQGMSVEDLRTAEQRLGDQKHIIADSWQLMSNPNIQFPKTDLTHGALDNPNQMIKGGFGQLPSSVQKAITGDPNDTLWEMSNLPHIVQDGDPRFQTGTDLDRGLIHKAAVMLDYGGNYDSGWAHSAISDTLSAVSPDHQVVHDALTGQMHDPQFAVDKDKFMHDITHHVWEDKGEGAGKLFSWTETAAHDPAQAQIAGETAHAYSEYIGTHERDLLNVDGRTLGELDPYLVQGMAHGLTPYVNNIAGTSGGLDQFGSSLDPGHISDGTLPNAKGVFSVLNTDPEAAKVFDGAAYGQALLHDTAYAQHPDTSERPDQLYDSATLRALVDIGHHNAISAHGENQAVTAKEEYAWKSAAYDAGIKALSATGAAIPGSGPLTGPSIDIAGSALKNDIIGPPPSDPTSHPIPRLAPEYADAEMLNTLQAVGHPIVGVPAEYHLNNDPDARILTAEEMEAKGVTAGKYQEVIGDAIHQTLGYKFQDEAIKDRYDQIAADPDPQKK